MPKFISDEGVWVPAKEKVALVRVNEDGNEEPFIYEGPDRAAMEMLKDMDLAEVGYMGQHFTENVDLFELARAKGYDNVEEYVKRLGYKSEKAKELVEKYKKTYHTHEAPKKVQGTTFSGGGVNTATGQGNKLGGFGEPGE